MNKLHVLNQNNMNLPLLIVPYNHKGVDHKGCDGGYFSVCDDTIGFISLFDDDVKKKKLVHKLYLPEIADRRICGSSEGWLITVHENTEVQLLNPFTKVLIHLPPLTSFPEVVEKILSKEGLYYYFVNASSFSDDDDHQVFNAYDSHHFRESFFKKVVTTTTTTTTSSSTTTVVIVMAIYGPSMKLAFCRPSGNDDEQKKWMGCLQGDKGFYDDVTFYKGNFYAVNSCGVVVVKGLDGPSVPFVETILIEGEEDLYTYKNYLVESSSSSSDADGDGEGGGDLLKVMRRVETKYKKEEGHTYRTTGFKVMKLDFNGGAPSLVEVTNLSEDCALFIGFNHSFSLSASKITGCKGNCIYFTDDKMLMGKGYDMGIYNLEDGSIERLYETTSSSSSQIFMPPPVWYVPN